MKVAVLHGPNLNLLGRREPQVYGRTTLAEIDAMLREKAEAAGIDLTCEQWDGEGELVRAVHRAGEKADAIVINPGAYGHYSLALADAIRGVAIPTVEVHLSNVFAREPFRQQLVTAPACQAVVLGLGAFGYLLALDAAVHLASKHRGAASRSE